MRFWLAAGLGFALNHVEQSFDRLFGLKGEPDEYVEFPLRGCCAQIQDAAFAELCILWISANAVSIVDLGAYGELLLSREVWENCRKFQRRLPSQYLG